MVDPDGRLVARFGDVERRFLVRSSAKPFQAAVALEHGADLPPEHVALACASHDGTSTHIEIVRAMLSDGGLSESDLRCPPDRPLGSAADRSLAARGIVDPRRILHNCSGKHAAMLRACAASGWPLETYLEPGHPLQQAITAHLVEAGVCVDDAIGVDGCGAPVHPVTAESLAVGYSRLVEERYQRVWDGMSRYPALVSGTGNVDEVVAVGLDAVAKRGAEGLLAISVRGRGAMVVRTWDGSFRAVAPATVRSLLDAGWITDVDPIVASLERSVLGGGRPVGTVSAPFHLESL